MNSTEGITERTENKLLGLYEQFMNKGDEDNSRALLSLMKKTKGNSIHIALCGHFSAGKSTFINELFGEGLLPTSPIPTSANTVQFSYSEREEVLFTLSGGDQVVHDGGFGEQDLQALCKNGDEITHIEIRKSHPYLEKGVTLLDTPGIDSTDEAHKLATESQIPTIDCILYMMDYNHVQSAINVEFIQKMKERNKKIYLMINQIDKHQEAEVSFQQYRASICETFARCDVKEDDIYFISLREKEHLFNDLPQVYTLLEQLIDQKEVYIQGNYDRECVYLMNQHISEVGPEQEQIDQVDWEAFHKLEEEQGQWMEKVQSNRTLFQRGIGEIVQHAYLMPYELRELAREYLESLAPTFKVGMLFAKDKTEKERQRRYDVFYQQLSEIITSQVDTHIKEFTNKFARDNDVKNEELYAGIYTLGIPVPKEMLSKLIKPGAQMSGEYLLRYGDDLANEVRRAYREYYLAFYDEQGSNWVKAYEKEIKRLDHELASYRQAISLEKQRDEREAEIQLYRCQLEDIIAGGTREQKETIDAVIARNERMVKKDMKASLLMKEEEKQENVVATKVESGDGFSFQEKTKKFLSSVEQVEAMLENYAPLRHMQENMGDKRNRIEKKEFTVALFGAFSAGKSSFANALIGADILPSSPNPTTATINKITAPTDTYGHGTVVMKRMGELMQVTIADLAYYVTNEEEASHIEWIEVYYDCKLTRMGVTLVDTPGADSVNNRHTDVAFQYIKNADAILFVTYYNHVFSRGDREFLIQLGRVKNTFEMDKMFFIVNAIDLAADEAEVKSVETYIENQLVQYGITNPRIHGVSSKEALRGDREQSKIGEFEKGFYSFILKDLVQLSVTSLQDMLVTSHKQVSTMIESMEQSADEKDKRKQQLVREEAEQKEIVLQYPKGTDEKALQLECEELLFYVKKRVLRRINDVFVEFFNPSVVTKDKDVLRRCLEELLEFVGNDSAQEVRATSLRLEKWIRGRLHHKQENMLEAIQEINEQAIFSVEVPMEFATMEGQQPFEGMNMSRFQPALALFKNPKAFFEKNEKIFMLEEIQKQLEEPLTTYLSMTQETLVNHYQQQYEGHFEGIQEAIQEEMASFYETMHYALTNQEDVQGYKELQQTLDQVIAEHIGGNTTVTNGL